MMASTPASDLDRAFLVEQFRDYLALEAGNSGNTVENYARDIRRLVTRAVANGARGPDEITAAQLRELIYDLKDVGLSPATIRRQISALRTYYRFLVGEGRVTRDPTERIESPRQWRQFRHKWRSGPTRYRWSWRRNFRSPCLIRWLWR